MISAVSVVSVGIAPIAPARTATPASPAPPDGPPREGDGPGLAPTPTTAPAPAPAPRVVTRMRVVRFYKCTACDRHHHMEEPAYKQHLKYRDERGLQGATVGRDFLR